MPLEKIPAWPHSPVFIAAVNIEDLVARRTTLVAEADRLCDIEGRDLTEDELTRVEKIAGEVEGLNKQIAALEKLRPAAPPRRSDPEPSNRAPARNDPAPGRARVDPAPVQGRGTFGFSNFGEFARTVHQASLGGTAANERFLNAATTYGSEASGTDGGFVVPPDFRATIWQKVNAEDSLLSRATPFVCSGNSISFPKDETTPWDTSSGVQCYWDSEAAQINQSKPAFQLETAWLAKLTALVPVSEELLEDAPAIGSYLQAKVPTKMQSKLNTAIIRGNGVGKPKGILGSASLITVTAETSQNMATILAQNIINMWSRMYAPCRRNAVWLINQDCEPQLDVLAFPNAGYPIPLYMPSGGLSASPYSTLKGRPVIPCEACSTVGTVGDIILVDMSQYMALTKGQEIRTDISMHLYFDQALMAFRFIFRVNGQPLWTSSITPENGTMTRSWCIALESRP